MSWEMEKARAVSFQVDPRIKRALQEKAKAEGKSLSRVVAEIVEKAKLPLEPGHELTRENGLRVSALACDAGRITTREMCEVIQFLGYWEATGRVREKERSFYRRKALLKRLGFDVSALSCVRLQG
jgi:predicted transcriptional regulator